MRDSTAGMENVHPRPEASTAEWAGVVIVLPPGAGRHYACGPMQSVFLADGEETGGRYAVSIWWVNPHQSGPGPHVHAANEELFYVIEGTVTFRVGSRYVDGPSGTFVRVPAGVTHDFENRTSERAGVFNVFIPGDFETKMPAIVDWYRERDSVDR
jgi:mannose-6-phosphate isomerase-like protein (cupin superfamily)